MFLTSTDRRATNFTLDFRKRFPIMLAFFLTPFITMSNASHLDVNDAFFRTVLYDYSTLTAEIEATTNPGQSLATTLAHSQAFTELPSGIAMSRGPLADGAEPSQEPDPIELTCGSIRSMNVCSIEQDNAPQANKSMDFNSRSDRLFDLQVGPDIFASISIRSSSRAITSLVASSNIAAERLPDHCFEVGQSNGCAVQIPNRWQLFARQIKNFPEREIVRRVNAEVNASIAYRSDSDNYSKFDYWADAIETMSRSAGDCEDLAILKMWLLINLGVNPDDLYIVVVRSRRLAAQHAVLAVRKQGTFLILDSLAREIAPADEIRDYIPVFSVNGRSIWLHGFPAAHAVAELQGVNAESGYRGPALANQPQ